MTGARARRVLLALALGLALAPAAAAQSLSGYVEVGKTATTTDFRSLQTTPSTDYHDETDYRYGRLSLDFGQYLWPNLMFEVGGLFEQSRVSSGSEQDLPNAYGRRLLPYVLLRLNNEINQAEAGWRRIEQSGWVEDGPRRTLIRDAWGLSYGWYPNATDFIRLAWARAEDSDPGRQTLDRDRTSYALEASYRPIDELVLDYRGIVSQTRDNIEDEESETTIQTGRVNYGDVFYGGRLALSASWDGSWTQFEARAGGRGEIALPVTALRGLSALSDIPAAVVLSPNQALIDGNAIASAGVNLGYVPVSGDRRLRNFGFDFEFAKSTNALRIWIARDLPEEIARTYTWELWGSTDNIRWERLRTIANAPFGPFERYFELRFAQVTSRYLKLVVAPLGQGVQNAAEYPDVLVTEIQALAIREVQDESVSGSTNQQRFYVGGQYQILPTPLLTYSAFYVSDYVDGSLTSDTFSNIVSVTQPFARVWVASGQAGFETGRNLGLRRYAWFLGAGLTVNPLPTLNASLTALDRHESYDNELPGSNTSSAQLNLSAALYKGISLRLNAGSSQSDIEDGRDSDTVTLGGALELIPLPAVVLTLDYQADRNRVGSPGFDDFRTTTEIMEASISLTPVPSFYLFASYRIEDNSAAEEPRRLTTGSVSWSPFAGGSLRFSVNYDEYYDSLFDTETRTWGASARWYVTRSSLLTVGYNRLAIDSTREELQSDSLYASLRITF